MNHRKPGEVGLSFKSISGMQRLWCFVALLITLAGISPFKYIQDKHSSLKHVAITVQKGL